MTDTAHFPALPASFQPCSLHPLYSEEDGTPYEHICLCDTARGRCILKCAKGDELANYRRYLADNPPFAPRLLKTIPRGEETFLLLENISGENLQRCARPALTVALDALIELQRRYWNASDDGSFAATLPGRQKRRAYLADTRLIAQYDCFLQLYNSIPRTLCHDDLLPFNVIANGDRAVLIDWEHAGILPYPVSLARLIAHGTEDPDALFYLTQADRDFAVGYYYDRLLAPLGIGYEVYRRDLDYFLFYEYCEWVFLGHKYDQTNGEYYRRYKLLADRHAAYLAERYGR